MLVTFEYNRERALAYARRWAFDRNPLFENYTGIGGDCTNFTSQALYAGSCVMNFTPTFGWFYLSDSYRAPAWTGVEFFYNFITSNNGPAPFGTETTEEGVEVGDIIQLANASGDYYHSLLVTGRGENGILVSAHSNDAFDRPLSDYSFATARYIHIEGVRIDLPDRLFPNCFIGLISGRQL